MSTLASFISCPNVQVGLGEVFFGQSNLKSYNQGNILKFLTSGTNTDGVMKSTVATGGKLKTVEVVYGQRYTVDEVGDSGIVTCETGTVQGETSKTYTLDPADGSNIKWSVPTSELRRRCEADANYINREILKAMNAVIAGAEKKTADKLVLNLGNFASDVDAGQPAGTSTYKAAPGYDSSNRLSYAAYEMVSYETMANDFMTVPVVFGGESWFKYAKAIGAACCGDNGVDAGLYATNNPYLFSYSREIPAATGETSSAVALVPGAVQLLWANEFEQEILQFDNGSLFQGTLLYPDPALPITFDYRAEYVCGEGGSKVWKFELALNHDVVFMPDDMFKATDRLFGVNGVNEYRICGSNATCEVG